MKAPAKIIQCPGYVSDHQNHTMLDNCWTCAPWWEDIRLCPIHEMKLPSSGWCRLCHKFYETDLEKIKVAQ